MVGGNGRSVAFHPQQEWERKISQRKHNPSSRGNEINSQTRPTNKPSTWIHRNRSKPQSVLVPVPGMSHWSIETPWLTCIQFHHPLSLPQLHGSHGSPLQCSSLNLQLREGAALRLLRFLQLLPQLRGLQFWGPLGPGRAWKSLGDEVAFQQKKCNGFVFNVLIPRKRSYLGKNLGWIYKN